ncbi:MAG: hypothetical protein FJZ01_12770 [Candidatus Sericytochromatia bacterium]|nr:hypothetical protein [Candidatus Tanganyikabacteria bacterium]
MAADSPLFWVISEVDHHLVVPHPDNGLPVVLVFSGKARADAFDAANPQRHAIAKGVLEADVALQMRQWAYGGIEYFCVDPERPDGGWEPVPVSRFREYIPVLRERGAGADAANAAQVAQAEAAAREREQAELQAEVHGKLFPAKPEPPPAPRPWYEAHGLD